LNDYSELSGIEIYPNPASLSLVIRHWSLGKEATLEIFNTLGEQALSPLFWKGVGNEAVDVSSLPNGVYFLKIESGERTVNKKFAVVHD